MAKQETKMVLVEFIFWFISFSAFKAILILAGALFGHFPSEGSFAVVIVKIFKHNLGDAIAITLLSRLWQVIKTRYMNS